jgi:hypothetical protein
MPFLEFNSSTLNLSYPLTDQLENFLPMLASETRVSHAILADLIMLLV